MVGKALVKRWPTEKKLVMSDIPWLGVDERLLRNCNARVMHRDMQFFTWEDQKMCPSLVLCKTVNW